MLTGDLQMTGGEGSSHSASPPGAEWTAGLGISIQATQLSRVWAWAVLDPGGHSVPGEGGVGQRA